MAAQSSDDAIEKERTGSRSRVICADGRLEADNNGAERALRGERAAAIYTLVGTTKLNKLDPEAYLRYVLERIAEHPINRIEELLPWNVPLATPAATSLAA